MHTIINKYGGIKDPMANGGWSPRVNDDIVNALTQAVQTKFKNLYAQEKNEIDMRIKAIKQGY